jgi:bla regulator protein blaR1
MIEMSILLKASVMLALGLAAARLSIRAQAAVRHLWLAATLATLAVLPVLTLAAPAVMIPIPATFAAISLPPAPARSTGAPAAPPAVRDEAGVPRGFRAADGSLTAPTWLTLVRWGWAAGAVAVFASLIVSIVRVRRIRRHCVPLAGIQQLARTLAAEGGIRRTVDVLEHESVPAPFTCGLWHPAIVLPCDARSWDEADVRRAIVHELEHVRRGDWAVQLGARAVCAVYWFHPLVWTAWRGLCLEAERACDDAVVKAADRADYAEQLVLLARRLSGVRADAVLGMANRSDLAARITALLDDRQRRGRAGAVAAASALAVSALVVAAIAPVRAVAAKDIATADIAAAFAQRPATVEERGRIATVTLTREPRGEDARARRAAPLDRALYGAAEDGDIEAIDQLLQAGANVNAVIDGDGSPLIAAARTGHLSAVKHLIDRGADPNLAVPGDGAPLLAAAREGQTAVIALLLDRRANIELIVPGDENALIQASGNGNLDAVKLLLARGANVSARVWVDRDSSGQGEWRSPLSMARKGRYDAVVAALIAAGARE